MKPIKGFEGHYSINEKGEILSIKSNKILRQFEGNVQYKMVGLSKNGFSKHYLIHRLLAETFIPNPNKLPFVDHKDRDKSNNSLNNLRWCTVTQNSMNGNKRTVYGISTSKYKGVTWDKVNKKWSVHGTKNKKVINLGRYLTENEAAKAYNNFAIENYKEFAVLNLINIV